MTKREKQVGFREEPSIITRIDNIANKSGIDRSDFIRQAVREKLSKFPEG